MVARPTRSLFHGRSAHGRSAHGRSDRMVAQPTDALPKVTRPTRSLSPRSFSVSRRGRGGGGGGEVEETEAAARWRRRRRRQSGGGGGGGEAARRPDHRAPTERRRSPVQAGSNTSIREGTPRDPYALVKCGSNVRSTCFGGDGTTKNIVDDSKPRSASRDPRLRHDSAASIA
jgi:hypothetical protein